MVMHLVSSLSQDDECRLAPQMLEAIGRVLESMPVSYSVRIETALGSEIRKSHTGRTTRLAGDLTLSGPSPVEPVWPSEQ